jgi:hypothetical protein
VQIYTASDCTGFGNISRSNFVKAFSALLIDVSSITKAPSLQCFLQSQKQKKLAGARSIPIGVLEHSLEAETNFWFSIFCDFSFLLLP